MVHWIEAPDPSAAPELAKIIAALSGRTAIAADAKPCSLINPYRVLDTLGEAEADYFFGRNCETAEILNALNTTANKAIALVGNSGAENRHWRKPASLTSPPNSP